MTCSFSIAAQSPSSKYAPLMDTVHHKNATSAPSPLPGRDFEGVGWFGSDRVPDKGKSRQLHGQAEERFLTTNSPRKAIKLLQ